jgi:peroxiredoxin
MPTVIKTMKVHALLFLFLVNTALAYSQNANRSADSVLEKISRGLRGINAIKYANTRELNYSSENYHHISKWTAYYDFQSTDRLTGFRYQIDDSASKQIFNGTEKFDLHHKARTITVNDSPTKNSFRQLSALYNSIVTLKNILPLIISDKNATKNIADTVINKKVYDLITINIGKRRIQNPGEGFDSMTTKYNFIYKIVSDKSTFLPLAVIQNNDANTDFIKTTFTNIQTNPDPPSESSWYYSTYMNAYTIAGDALARQLLPNGSTAPDWQLTVYGENKTLGLDELKGNVVLLDFWIKNCGPCIQSVPHLNELRNTFKDEKLKIISINSYDAKEDVKRFYDKHKIKYTVLMNGKDVATSYGVSGFPAFFILDKTGKIIFSHTGYDASVQAAIEAVIKKSL